MSNALVVAFGVAIVLLVGGGLATPIGPWYRNLRKPRLQPPNWLFGPAWTVILGLSAWSAATAWDSTTDPATHRAIIIVFAVNALCHAAWSPLFFKARRPDWALIEVVFLWISIAMLMIVLWPISHKAALLNLPYLLWVSFASWLNSAIVRLNGPFGTTQTG